MGNVGRARDKDPSTGQQGSTVRHFAHSSHGQAEIGLLKGEGGQKIDASKFARLQGAKSEIQVPTA